MQMVFDGCSLPAKAATQAERRDRKRRAIARAQALAEDGRGEEADKLYAQTVDVTPDMAHELILRLRWAGFHHPAA